MKNVWRKNQANFWTGLLIAAQMLFVILLIAGK